MMTPMDLDIEAFGRWTSNNLLIPKKLILLDTKGEMFMSIVETNRFSRGEVLNVVVPDAVHPQKKIQRQRNVLVGQKIDKVVILGCDGNNIYRAVPCNTKHKKGAVPVRVGYLSFYAQAKPVLHIDADVLHRFENSELHDKDQVLEKLEDNIRRHIESRERRKTQRKDTDYQPKRNVYDNLMLANKIQYKPDNVVCPVCRKLLPTAERYVYIEGEGTPVLRVGLCRQCATYYSFSNKLLRKPGECNGAPVVWSNLRYLRGKDENIQFKTIKRREIQEGESSEIKTEKSNGIENEVAEGIESDKIPLTSPQYPALLKQIPVLSTHSNKCPICNKTPEVMTKIEYLIFDNNGNSKKRFGHARQCSACGSVFLDEGQARAITNQSDGFRMFTFEATRFSTAKEMMDFAEKEPSRHKLSPTKDNFPFSFSEMEVPNLSSESKVVSVYAKKCHCQQCLKKYGVETIRNRTAVVSTVSGETINVNVMYCVGCGKYFMNYTSFELYRKSHGGLLLEYRFTGELVKNNSSDFNFAPDSILSRCGYTVQYGVSKEYRHAILRYILESRKATKREIIELITSFIDLRDYNPMFDGACARWREDIFFVNQYQLESQKKVYGLRFVQGK